MSTFLFTFAVSFLVSFLLFGFIIGFICYKMNLFYSQTTKKRKLSGNIGELVILYRTKGKLAMKVDESLHSVQTNCGLLYFEFNDKHCLLLIKKHRAICSHKLRAVGNRHYIGKCV